MHHWQPKVKVFVWIQVSYYGQNEMDTAMLAQHCLNFASQFGIKKSCSGCIALDIYRARFYFVCLSKNFCRTTRNCTAWEAW